MSSEQAPNIAQPGLSLVQPPVHIVPKGPVLTEALFDKIVATIEYHIYDGTTTMACALKLRNGFAVVGHAATLPTGDFTLQDGMKYALQDAKNKLGETLALMIYDLVCPGHLRIAPSVEHTLNALKESANG